MRENLKDISINIFFCETLMKQKATLTLLFASLFILGLAVSLGFISPIISQMEIRDHLMATYGVASPEEFTKLTGLTLKAPDQPDFYMLSMQLNTFSMIFFATLSLFGGKIKKQITKTILILLILTFLTGFMSGIQYAKAATPTYTIEPEGLLPKAYDYIIYVSGSTYYRINGADSTVTSGTDDDTIIQYALNQSKSVIIKAGTYSATVTFKGGRLIIEKGATGITYTVDSSATGWIEDKNTPKTEYYNSGTLIARFDYSTGKVWWNQQNVTDIWKNPEQTATFIIFGKDTNDDGVYDVVYAKNTTSGQIQYGGEWDAGGVDGSNASAVIQAVINALTNGVIYLKNGVYDISSSITLKSDVSIIGESWNATILRASGKYLSFEYSPVAFLLAPVVSGCVSITSVV